ncbi:MAG: hypothetical protein ACK56F_04765, partial [bacterium]
MRDTQRSPLNESEGDPRDAVPGVPRLIRCASPIRERRRGPLSRRTIPIPPSGLLNAHGLDGDVRDHIPTGGGHCSTH